MLPRPPLALLALVDGLPHHARGLRPPADVDRQPRLRPGQLGADVCEPDADVEQGRERARRDLAALRDRHPLARDRLLLHDEGDELLGGAFLLLRAEHVDPGELLVERAGPAEPGLDRRPLRGDVVSVQRVAGLQSQRVAGAEAARDDAALDDRVPEAGGLLRRAAELAAALARVAGAGHEAGDAEHLLLAEAERLDVDAEPAERLRALHGEEGPLG